MERAGNTGFLMNGPGIGTCIPNVMENTPNCAMITGFYLLIICPDFHLFALVK